MSEKRIRSQIQLRYDSYENWMSADPVLLKGEAAMAVMPAEDGSTVSITAKIGDGVKNYSLLPFLTAKAGDVPAWAKAATKPTYTAEEIEGLEDYINDTIEDTNTKYQIIQGEDNKTFILQSKELDGTDWTDEFTLHIPEDITYTLTSENAGELTFTPSEGEPQTVQIIEIETDGTQIESTNDRVPTSGAVADFMDDKMDEIQDKIDEASARVFRFRGTVAAVKDLPTENNEVGDTYHVKSTKAEYTWAAKTDDEGSEYFEWEKLGNDMDLSTYPTKDEMDDALALKHDLITETNKLSVDLVDGVATTEKDGLMSADDKTKLDSLEEGAQENVIEKVVAGDALLPITDKTVTLAKIAQTGNVMDLIQDEDNVVILDGGNAFGLAPIETNTLILNGGNSVQ